MLSQNQIDAYNENGYLAIENVLSKDELKALHTVTDEYVEQSRRVTESNDIFDLEPGHTPESPKLRRIKKPAVAHPVYGQTMRHSGALDIISQLIGPNIRAIGHKLNMKSGEFGSPVEWHQDWAFFPHTNNNVLAIGICLDDMTEANGCLMVSHRKLKWPK
jgi:phytanoyl-CoA hydroxylase